MQACLSACFPISVKLRSALDPHPSAHMPPFFCPSRTRPLCAVWPLGAANRSWIPGGQDTRLWHRLSRGDGGINPDMQRTSSAPRWYHRDASWQLLALWWVSVSRESFAWDEEGSALLIDETGCVPAHLQPPSARLHPDCHRGVLAWGHCGTGADSGHWSVSVTAIGLQPVQSALHLDG